MITIFWTLTQGVRGISRSMVFCRGSTNASTITPTFQRSFGSSLIECVLLPSRTIGAKRLLNPRTILDSPPVGATRVADSVHIEVLVLTVRFRRLPALFSQPLERFYLLLVGAIFVFRSFYLFVIRFDVSAQILDFGGDLCRRDQIESVSFARKWPEERRVIHRIGNWGCFVAHSNSH